MKATKENQKALKIFQVDGTACLYLKKATVRVEKGEVSNAVTMLPNLVFMERQFSKHQRYFHYYFISIQCESKIITDLP